MNYNIFYNYFKKISLSNTFPQNLNIKNIKGITSNSRNVKNNYLFVAVKGPFNDGHSFIEDALKSGASYVLCNNDYSNLELQNKKKLIKLKSTYTTDVVYFELLNKFYNNILDNFLFTGITGTNGKTSTSYLLNNIFKSAEKKSFIIGTTGCIYSRKKYELKNTTPGADELFEIYIYACKKNYNSVVMEVSSHALDQNRVPADIFKGTIFTNLTLDHLDYHKNTENYFKAKLKLFESKNKNKIASINIDDKYGARIYGICSYKNKVSYSINNKNADFYCENTQYTYENTIFNIIHKNTSKIIKIKSNLIGEHNVYNILAAVSLAYSMKIPVSKIEKGILKTDVVPGRLEKILLNKRLFMVDYAHTPDALLNVLKILNLIKKNRIITVFGCGGDRDKSKRPRMFEVAVKHSDLVVVTSDNPRTENCDTIIEDIIAEQKESTNYIVVSNRRKAIRKSYELSEIDDIILVAGKGHENYQIIGKKVHHFSDSEEILKLK